MTNALAPGGGLSTAIASASVARNTPSSPVGKRYGRTLFVSDAIPTGTPGSEARILAAAALARSIRDGAPGFDWASIERVMSTSTNTCASERARREHAPAERRLGEAERVPQPLGSSGDGEEPRERDDHRERDQCGERRGELDAHPRRFGNPTACFT